MREFLKDIGRGALYVGGACLVVAVIFGCATFIVWTAQHAMWLFCTIWGLAICWFVGFLVRTGDQGYIEEDDLLDYM